jgi:hypothetical protein
MLADPNLLRKSSVAHLAVKCGPTEARSLEDGPHPQDSFWLRHGDIPSSAVDILYSESEFNDGPLAKAIRAGTSGALLRMTASVSVPME